MPARRPLPSDRPVMIRSALMTPDAVPPSAAAIPAPVWDDDDFEAAFFGGLIVEPASDPMFAGAADAGPLALDGAPDLDADDRLSAAFRSE